MKVVARVAAPPPDQSLQRTYRYLRLAIAGTVVVLGTGVVVASITDEVLGSISAYYYSPARNAFVGALFAAAIGMLALSGRGAPRALLDAAALFAPLIAIIPTPIGAEEIPGLEVDCAPARCVPSIVHADIGNGIAAYLVFGAGALLTAAVISVLEGRRTGRISVGVVGSLGVGGTVLATVLATWLVARDAVIAYGHVVATIVFFLLIAIVVVSNAVPRVWRAVERPGDEPPPRWMQVAYAVIAGVLVVDLAIFAVAITTDFAFVVPPVLVTEFIALGLFCVFWVLQTAQHRAGARPTVN